MKSNSQFNEKRKIKLNYFRFSAQLCITMKTNILIAKKKINVYVLYMFKTIINKITQGRKINTSHNTRQSLIKLYKEEK